MNAQVLSVLLAISAGPIPPEIQQKIEAALPASAQAKPAKARKVLIYTHAAGYVHSSIPFGAFALDRLGVKTGSYQATLSDQSSSFLPASLAGFDAVILVSTTLDFLPEDIRGNLLSFVENGGGLIGIHAASDAFYNWPEFGKLIGGWFNGHPWHEKVGIRVEDPSSPICAAFVSSPDFSVVDEIYQFKDPYNRKDIRVLLSLDPLRTDMAKQGMNRADGDYPVAWIKKQGKGRVFYCSLGHREEIYWNPVILKHYLAGIQYALGDLKADTSPLPLPETKDPYMGEYKGPGALAQVYPSGVGVYKIVIRPEGGKAPIELRGSQVAGGLSVSSGGGYEDAIPVWFVDGPYTGEDPVKGDGKHRGTSRPIESESGQPGFMDLAKLVGGENRHVYLKTEVFSPAGGEAILEIGSDDGVRAWLGGKKVHDNMVMRGFEPAQDRVSVTLAQGWNNLQLRIDQGGGGWAAWARFRNTDGSPIPGLRAKAGREVELTPKSTPDWSGSIRNGILDVKSKSSSFHLSSFNRVSPSMGAKPPKGAEVPEWANANWLKLPDGSMEVRGGDNRTVKNYGDCKVHVEFRIPYEPGKGGQGRGNSGVYLQDRYEVQVLDSFGLEMGPGDCGAIYQIAIPPVNVCLPPLTWQTYDITFKAPRFDASGNKKENGRISVLHNGVEIHRDVELPKTTGGAAPGEVPLAPLRLQDHGNPVRFRNIWVLPQ